MDRNSPGSAMRDPAMRTRINWQRLAREVGSIHRSGERGGSGLASIALERILGEAELRAAVDYCVSGRPGAQLANSVLCLVRSWTAMKRCYEIFRSREDERRRVAAVGLLSHMGDERVLQWVGEFLADPAPGVQTCGMSILDQMIEGWTVLPAEVKRLVREAARHPNERVRELAESIAWRIGERRRLASVLRRARPRNWPGSLESQRARARTRHRE